MKRRPWALEIGEGCDKPCRGDSTKTLALPTRVDAIAMVQC